MNPIKQRFRPKSARGARRAARAELFAARGAARTRFLGARRAHDRKPRPIAS